MTYGDSNYDLGAARLSNAMVVPKKKVRSVEDQFISPLRIKSIPHGMNPPRFERKLVDS